MTRGFICDYCETRVVKDDYRTHAHTKRHRETKLAHEIGILQGIWLKLGDVGLISRLPDGVRDFCILQEVVNKQGVACVYGPECKYGGRCRYSHLLTQREIHEHLDRFLDILAGSSGSLDSQAQQSQSLDNPMSKRQLRRRMQLTRWLEHRFGFMEQSQEF